jgi:hypothetical protein
MSSELERRYHRLLRIYPRSYRERRGEEMVATLVETAAPGQTRPSRADRADLYAGAAREWLGIHAVRGLGPALRLVAPVMLALTAGYALSGWAVPGSQEVTGQHDTIAVVVSALWVLAVLVRAVVPRASLVAVSLAWLVTAGVGTAIAVAGRSTLGSGGLLHGFPDALTFETTAGLVALIAVGTTASRPSIVERLAVPLAAAALVGAALLERAGEQSATRPAWVDLLWTLPVAALVVGLGVRARTGSTRWLWAAALLLPLLSYGLMQAYVRFPPLLPLLYPVLGGWLPVLATSLVCGVVVAVMVGLAALAATRGPAVAFRRGGSLGIGTAAGLSLYLLVDAAYHGDADAAPAGPWALAVPMVLATVALLVPTGPARILAVVAAGSVVASVLVARGNETWVEFGTAGALFLLLLVGAASASVRDGGRRAGLGALFGAFALTAAASTVSSGGPLPSGLDAQTAILPGLAAAVLVPMAYWSGRRLVLAGTGWLAAVPAFAGSALWVTLLVGPAGTPTAAAALVGGLVLALLAVRTGRRRVRRAGTLDSQPLIP